MQRRQIKNTIRKSTYHIISDRILNPMLKEHTKSKNVKVQHKTGLKVKELRIASLKKESSNILSSTKK